MLENVGMVTMVWNVVGASIKDCCDVAAVLTCVRLTCAGSEVTSKVGAQRENKLCQRRRKGGEWLVGKLRARPERRD